MGMLSNVMNFFSLGNDEDGEDIYDDYDDVLEDDFDEPEPEPEVKPRSRSTRFDRTSKRRRSTDIEDSMDDYESDSTSYSGRSGYNKSSNSGKVVSLRTNNGQSVEFEIQTKRPKNFEDSSAICDIIKSGKPVIVNLEGIEDSMAQRIIDIVSGCVYAMDGNFCNVSLNVAVFTPGNVVISGELVNGSDFIDNVFKQKSSRSSSW
ncbi:MAG: cell division protein SepF [Lachnospiraceae bacterium]|nr:cell division protein SepF [Lachnospiraceae bacterium]